MDRNMQRPDMDRMLLFVTMLSHGELKWETDIQEAMFKMFAFLFTADYLELYDRPWVIIDACHNGRRQSTPRSLKKLGFSGLLAGYFVDGEIIVCWNTSNS